jgi:hypothetical protein
MSASPPDLEWEEKKVLIIGRASPEPSKKHFETVCTGGISEEGHLLRLYPIPLRYLEEEKRYRLWSWVKFDIQKNPSDRRKESYKIRQETITILSQVQSEAEQFSLLRKAIFPDREKLDELYHHDWTSLGVIEIEVIELATREAEKNWAVQKPYINQFDLFIERKPLDRSPVDLRLRFRCKNNPNCKSHVSTLIGWEILKPFANSSKNTVAVRAVLKN